MSADADTKPLKGTSVPAARRHQHRRQKFGQGSHPDPEQATTRSEARSSGGSLGEAKTRQGGPGNKPLSKPGSLGAISIKGARVKTVPWGGQDRHGPGFSQDVVHDDLWRSVELLARTPLAPTTVRGCVVPQDPWFRGGS